MTARRPVNNGPALGGFSRAQAPQAPQRPAQPQIRARQVARPGPPPAPLQQMTRQSTGGIRPAAVMMQHNLARQGLSSMMQGARNSGAGATLGSLFGDNQTGGPYVCKGRDGKPCPNGLGGQPAVLTPGVEDYFLEGNVGPFCAECWADDWVDHSIGGLNSTLHANTCRFGVRYDEREWKAMGAFLQECIMGEEAGYVKNHGRYPTVAEVNQWLGQQFQFSRACPRCKQLLKGQTVNVKFSPDASKMQIEGVTVPVGSLTPGQ